MTKEIATQEPILPPVIKTEAQQLMDMIGALATNPQADVAKFNALLDLKERIVSKQAEAEFNDAYVKLVREIPRIKRTGSVSYKEKEAFKFAPWEQIDIIIRPLLEKHGFALTFDTAPKADGGAIITGTLLHVSGHSRSASIALALDNSGGKNNIQGMGSTFSYGKRYTATMLLNIVTEGEDDDGNSAENIGADETDILEKKIVSTGTDRANFLKLFRVKEVGLIQKRDLEKANAFLNLKGKLKEAS